MEIIVSDSGSADGSRELVKTRYPGVRLVELPEDRGLAAGRNGGMLVARGDFVLMMDEDVVITQEQVGRLVRLMQAHPEAGIVTCCKVNAQGEALYQHHVPAPGTLNLPFFITQEWSIQEGLRALKRLLRVGESRPHEQDEFVEIPFIGGAFLLARAEAIQQVGPWDENVFFYGEDFDWCYRMRRLGWKILYFPQIKVQAFHGTNSARTRRASLVALQSRRYLFFKHVRRGYRPVYYPMALLGLIPRAAYHLVQHVRGRDRGDVPLGRWLWHSIRIIVGRPPALSLRD
jgi:GT2 family glycosyltransferase